MSETTDSKLRIGTTTVDLAKRSDCRLVGRMAKLTGLPDDLIEQVVAKGLLLANQAADAGEARKYATLMKLMDCLAKTDQNEQRLGTPSLHQHVHVNMTAKDLAEELEA